LFRGLTLKKNTRELLSRVRLRTPSS